MLFPLEKYLFKFVNDDQMYVDCISLNFSLHFVTFFFIFWRAKEKGNSLAIQKNMIQRREKKEYRFYMPVYHFLNAHIWYDIFFFRKIIVNVLLIYE